MGYGIRKFIATLKKPQIEAKLLHYCEKATASEQICRYYIQAAVGYNFSFYLRFYFF